MVEPSVFEDIDKSVILEEATGPREFRTTTTKAGEKGTGKTLQREGFKKEDAPADKFIKEKAKGKLKKKQRFEKVIKKVSKAFSGIKLKAQLQRKTVSIGKAIPQAPRKSILSPTVFSTKITEGLNKPKKPISFFGKGRI